MPPPPIDPVFALFIGTLASASLATWFALAPRRPTLRYEPRPAVPWNGAVAAPILLVVGLNIWSVASGQEQLPLELSQRILGGIVSQLAIFGTTLVLAVALSNATRRDVGLPDGARQFRSDVTIGTVAWLAALLPVYATQALLARVFGKSSHPLLEMVNSAPNSQLLMLVAFLSAVVVAPICEECGFRLLLQGWLEKWEDQKLGWRLEQPTSSPEQSPDVIIDGVSVASAAEPPRRGLAGLPHGWAPIIVSAFLFALAHLGYGPDPVALFLFGLILGYVYQRTHRILPCIIAHALFNLTTLAMLALAFARG